MTIKKISAILRLVAFGGCCAVMSCKQQTVGSNRTALSSKSINSSHAGAPASGSSSSSSSANPAPAPVATGDLSQETPAPISNSDSVSVLATNLRLVCQRVDSGWHPIKNKDQRSVQCAPGYQLADCVFSYYDTNASVLYHGFEAGVISSDRMTCAYAVNDIGISEGQLVGECCGIF